MEAPLEAPEEDEDAIMIKVSTLKESGVVRWEWGGYSCVVKIAREKSVVW